MKKSLKNNFFKDGILSGVIAFALSILVVGSMAFFIAQGSYAILHFDADFWLELYSVFSFVDLLVFPAWLVAAAVLSSFFVPTKNVDKAQQRAIFFRNFLFAMVTLLILTSMVIVMPFVFIFLTIAAEKVF